jgi:DNA-binding response OmpR family regulator
MKVLLLEDDPVLVKEIQQFLKGKNILCEGVYDGDLFFRALERGSYDCFLLDINVPRLNGLEVCKHLKAMQPSAPILMLSAYSGIKDKSDAFLLGADDYLVKPFHLEELYLRIFSLLRRRGLSLTEASAEESDWIRVADLEVNLSSAEVYRAGKLIELTPKEYQLLVLLAKAKGRPISKQSIAEQVWDIHFDTSLNTIEVYINFLRKKIDRNYDQKLIHTRPGFGYYLKEK